MKTLEMMNEAAKTGRSYISDDMRYSSNSGFVNKLGYKWPSNSFKYINDIMNLSWEIIGPKKMTLKEIEEKLGYEIEIVNESNKDKINYGNYSNNSHCVSDFMCCNWIQK